MDMYQEALTICKHILMEDHFSTDNSFNDIRLVTKYRDDTNGALELYQKTLAVYNNVFGGDHRSTL